MSHDKKKLNYELIPLTIAIFSMFFGAGNTIFPLIIGVQTTANFGWAFIGLALTAVGGPLLGLVTATLFCGHSKDFFSRFGKIIGFVLMTVSLALLGPFAVLPRCTAVAYAATQPIFPFLSLAVFAILFGVIALFCCYKESFLFTILGYILSPLLIACLLFILYQGLLSDKMLAVASFSQGKAFTLGLFTGYDTMDLIASIFFSAGIWNMVVIRYPNQPKKALKMTLKAGILGCILLGAIYFGLGYTAALYSSDLINTPPQELISHLAMVTLGPKLSLIANAAVALACLTTVISLTMTISDILSKELFPRWISYKKSCFFILVITAAMTNIGFNVIMNIIHSVVSICYPIIILLTFINIFYKIRLIRRKNDPYLQ
ncbi:MAG: branched-chain amino acid transport system II carrier protein [Chlamydiota bacterium]